MKLPVILLALLPAVAWAQAPGDPVKALAAEAAEHFEAGRFCHAVQAYREAYKIEPLSELLYNIAYIHDRKLNDPEVARVYYQRFVRARDSDDKTRLKAYERLDTLRSTLSVASAQPALAPAATTHRDRLPVVDGASDGSGTRTTAWVALGVGAAALVTGATFAALATHSHSQFEDAEDAAARRELADEGESRALIGDIGLGVGLLGLATGGVLYLISQDDDGPTMGAAPTGDGGMTLGVSGTF